MSVVNKVENISDGRRSGMYVLLRVLAWLLVVAISTPHEKRKLTSQSAQALGVTEFRSWKLEHKNMVSIPVSNILLIQFLRGSALVPPRFNTRLLTEVQSSFPPPPYLTDPV